MTLQEIIDRLNLKVLTERDDFQSVEPTFGYTSDLLSCVMAGAKNKSIWITLQSHINIVAVAALLELSGVIVTEGAMPDQATIEKANEQGVSLFSTTEPTFAIAGKLWEMGIRES
jgi:hypothetical protein